MGGGKIIDKGKSNWALLTWSLVILGLAIAGCSSESRVSLEEQAQSIDRSLMCPVCPSETIDQAQVQLARQMRTVVRIKLVEGWSREQILQFFVDRYGERVLAAPPKAGFNLVVWLVPLAAVAAAVILLCFVIRAMRRGDQSSQEDQFLEERKLEPYLSWADHELGILQPGSPEPEKEG